MDLTHTPLCPCGRDDRQYMEAGGGEGFVIDYQRLSVKCVILFFLKSQRNCVNTMIHVKHVEKAS